MKDEYAATFDHGSVYVTIKSGISIKKTIRLDGAQVLVDIDKDNNILGIEVLNVKLDQTTT